MELGGRFLSSAWQSYRSTPPYSDCSNPFASNRPTLCPPYQGSPVAFSTRPLSPACVIKASHRGRISRRQEAESAESKLQSAPHCLAAVPAQRMNLILR